MRAVWAMKVKTRCTWRDAIAGMQVWFALSWVVSLACLRGLIHFHTAFLRTPKSREGESSILRALRSAQMEAVLAAAGIGAALAMLLRVPSIATGALALLLLFQAVVYANGPWAGAAAEGIHLTPMRRAYRSSAQSTGRWPSRGSETLAMSAAVGAIVLVMMVLLSLATPPAPPEPQPAAPAALSSPSPRHSPSPSPSSSPSPSGSPSASPSGSPRGSPSASPSPSPS